MKGKVPIKKSSTKTQQLDLKITEIVFFFVPRHPEMHNAIVRELLILSFDS